MREVQRSRERRPVTPEVAGSSPVAPVDKGPASRGLFRLYEPGLLQQRASLERIWKAAGAVTPSGRPSVSLRYPRRADELHHFRDFAPNRDDRGIGVMTACGRLTVWRTADGRLSPPPEACPEPLEPHAERAQLGNAL